TVARVLAAALSLVPGTKATLEAVNGGGRNAGYAGHLQYEPAGWVPRWAQLHDEVVERHGVVMATYDTYAVWTWSFSGAQQTGSWLPGRVKLGFDPKVLTGMGYLERNELVAKAFTGRESMCALLPPTGATDLLLERSSGFVARYEVKPAAAYRVDPRDRDLESIDREVGPGLRYRDAG